MSFDYRILKEIISDDLGYYLYMDYGSIEDVQRPYRAINEIVTPIVGVFRLNSITLTALQSPYIAVCTAMIDIPAPTEKAEEVRDALNNLAAKKNATTDKVTIGDTAYTIGYGIEAAEIGTRRRDISLYNGEVIPVTQTITYTITEAGVLSADMYLRIDGLDVPILTMVESRTAANETTTNSRAVGNVSVSQELYGVSFTTPYVDNSLGELLAEVTRHGNGNLAHAVEVGRDGGRSSVYLMTFGSISATTQQPNNVGYTVSMAEVAPQAAQYNGLWKTTTLSGTLGSYAVNDGAAIFWGDGTGDKLNGRVVHTYTDGLASHTARVLAYGDTSQWGAIRVGSKLNGVRVKSASGNLSSSDLSGELITMDSGDMLTISNGRLAMTVDGNEYYTLINAINSPFTTLLRGSVSAINTDLLVYDRWAVAADEEDDNG